MTPANTNDRRPTGVLRQVWWASVPIWSLGFLSFVPFLAHAVIQRRKQDWAVFAAYLAATVAMIVAVSAVGSTGAATAAVGGFVIALAGAAAIHAAVLFRPSRGVSPLASSMPLGTRQRNRLAVEEARNRIDRRKEARHLLQTNPALARDLHIGRPDLPRQYDDGGLVDVNRVAPMILIGHLGLTSAEADSVVRARDSLGRFTSADELCAYAGLSPDRVDELRDLMIFI
jgi:hypothetical protein